LRGSYWRAGVDRSCPRGSPAALTARTSHGFALLSINCHSSGLKIGRQSPARLRLSALKFPSGWLLVGCGPSRACRGMFDGNGHSLKDRKKTGSYQIMTSVALAFVCGGAMRRKKPGTLTRVARMFEARAIIDPATACCLPPKLARAGSRAAGEARDPSSFRRCQASAHDGPSELREFDAE
jgi:hypothetical protein